jgi:hypothetical protein
MLHPIRFLTCDFDSRVDALTADSDGGFTLAYNCNKVLLGPSFVSSLALGV